MNWLRSLSTLGKIGIASLLILFVFILVLLFGLIVPTEPVPEFTIDELVQTAMSEIVIEELAQTATLEIAATSDSDNPTAEEAATIERCVPASPEQIERLLSLVQDYQEGNSITNVSTVLSNDVTLVWMLAAEIIGSGIEPGKAIGVWAMNGEPNSPGLTFSVNSVARRFSGAPRGNEASAKLTMESDGAKEARRCARN